MGRRSNGCGGRTEGEAAQGTRPSQEQALIVVAISTLLRHMNGFFWQNERSGLVILG
jgi:hypothetical protein